MKQKVLIVDDSAFIRRVLTDWIAGEPDMELVGVGKNGREGVELAQKLNPDVMTLDVQMPIMDGLTALSEVRKTCPKVHVLMVSSVTTQGAVETIKALDLGAYDFFSKPNSATSLQFLESRGELLEKIRSARYVKSRVASPKPTPVATSPQKTSDKIVVIASSTGGPKTLVQLWESLPKGFPAPILIVQHMPAGFTHSFAMRLNQVGTVPCHEAKKGDAILPGQALLAPGGQHMLIGKDGRIVLNEEPTLHGVRPAADYLFETASTLYGNRVIGAVLTGMGRDGAEGAVTIRKAGGYVVGENESSCVVYGMPKAAMKAGGIDAELPLEEIGSAIVGALSRRLKNAS
ncbi:MAG: chemotaxis response regulator protein-glutamate methylesterase [Fimbriimonadaceae bacterium]|jgi:two-component system chemotaxis response regulator CheB|nr:chemotaxis response regulator protein-glutamate methylesterase [Fimbriimonadaceae bacterium]